MRWASVVLIPIGLLAGFMARSSTRPGPPASSESKRNAPFEIPRTSGVLFRNLPFGFERNEGQTSAAVQYLAHDRGSTVFFLRHEIDFVGAVGKGERRRSMLRLEFRGANPSPRILGLEELSGRSNYIRGRDPHGWKKNVARFGRVKYEGIYPGVDAIFYGGPEGLEYDLVVAPGADPDRIRLNISGAAGVSLDSRGDLRLTAAGGEVALPRPAIYQLVGNRRKQVQGGYVLRNGREISTHLGEYDRSRPLVIDPSVLYSSFLGGSDAELVSGTAVDSSGNVYVAGATRSVDFPAKPQQSKPGGSGNLDVFVAKFDTTKAGTNSLVYATFLGGGMDDQPFGIAVNGAGEAFVAGVTPSADFPLANAFQNTLAGTSDLFVTKLSASGSGLVFSTYYGGASTEGNAMLGGVAVDNLGGMYVTSDTESNDLFLLPGAFQQMLGGKGAANAFIAKFGPTGSLQYATYLGGTATDTSTGIAVDAAKMVYVAGFTSSTDFPVKNGCSSLPASFAGGASDAFVAKLDPSTTGQAQLVYSTFLGGGDQDQAFAIAVDGASPANAYVAGATLSSNFPITASAFQTALRGGQDAFLAVLGINGSGQVCPSYSTYLGGASDDSARSVAVNATGKVYLTGQTSSSDFPNQSASQAALLGPSDAFVAKLDSLSSGVASLLYSTFLGGKSSETGKGIALDGQGNAFVAGETSSSDFTVTAASAVQTACASCAAGLADAFVTRLSDTAAAATVGFTPSFVNFGNVSVGTSGLPMNISLGNTGNATLSLNAIAIVGSSEFGQTNNCPSTLAANATCGITVTFSPAAAGSASATLSVDDSATGSPHTVPLTGTGTAPMADAGPGALDFGSRPQGTTSSAADVTLKNSGNIALTITAINFSGTNSSDFSPKSDNCPIAPNALAAGSSCVISVVFAPSGTGPRSAQLNFTDDSNNLPGSAQIVALTGTGTPAAPLAAILPASHDFGEVNVGTAAGAAILTLTNSGNQTLQVSAIQLNGNSDFIFASAATPACTFGAPSQLAPNTSCNLAIRFQPSAAGAESAQLVVTDNSLNVANSTQVAPLTGTGAAPIASLTPPSFAFTSQLVGTTSPASVFDLKNKGAGRLDFQVSFGGANSGDFAESDVCGGNVGSAATCSLMVTFVPKSAGARSASLIVTDNSGGVPNSQQTVVLAGAATDFALQTAGGGSASATIQAGQTASYNLQVMPENGFSGQVSLSCAGAPLAASCTTLPDIVTITGASPALFQVMLATTASLPPQPAAPPGQPGLLLLSVGLFSCFAMFHRRSAAWRLATAAVLILLVLAGCGASEINSAPGTPPGTYAITATGTQQGVSRSIALSLQVR
jgi:Cep192 domain 4/HYDIN/CFA65/VesB-like, Ig-like domain/Beta-propeller repeat